MMEEELGTQEPLHERLNDLGINLLNSCAPNSSDAYAVEKSLDDLNKQWSKLQYQLADRTTRLQGAKDPSKDFKVFWETKCFQLASSFFRFVHAVVCLLLPDCHSVTF